MSIQSGVSAPREGGGEVTMDRTINTQRAAEEFRTILIKSKDIASRITQLTIKGCDQEVLTDILKQLGTVVKG